MGEEKARSERLMWEGLNDKDIARYKEFNVIKGCLDVEEETTWCTSSRCARLKKGRKRETTDNPMCKHDYLCLWWNTIYKRAYKIIREGAFVY